ncbi:hypothetical protein SAMN05421678_104123 [Actinopolymorpha cephalotaxi]|uniref:Uncharacterized protein n=1 Tax=Actinopolymorpha cephalotaxi TaxID=504797 RepID=A0A1I2PHH7_9ACTN|nr:hypothetical protein [Actinopolymorpha cephalotaxi]NYH83625.1 hypothetical protein [Actinopolymorpha cephalotaxi]SFG14903.1 hypothetical protein SAMN05421678_104123 [Actinopolymorpha cephalotaxi]
MTNKAVPYVQQVARGVRDTAARAVTVLAVTGSVPATVYTHSAAAGGMVRDRVARWLSHLGAVSVPASWSEATRSQHADLLRGGRGNRDSKAR